MGKALCAILAPLILLQPGCVFIGKDGMRSSDEVSKLHWLLFTLLGVFVVLFLVSSIVLLFDEGKHNTLSGRPEPNFGKTALFFISILMVLLLTG